MKKQNILIKYIIYGFLLLVGVIMLLVGFLNLDNVYAFAFLSIAGFCLTCFMSVFIATSVDVDFLNENNLKGKGRI